MTKNRPLPYLDDFLLNLQTNNLSDKTLYNYERDLNVFENFLNEEEIGFEHINKKTILNYKAYLTSIDRKTPKNQKGIKKLSSYSINRMLSVLRSYIKYLIDMDYDSPLSPEAIKLIKTEKKHPRVSEFEEVKRIIESPTEFEQNKLIGLRNRAMLEVLFSTGMRISELLNCKLDNIDKQGRIFIMGKGKKERFVYLTPRAQKHLNNYLEERNDSSSYMFIPHSGKNIKEKDKKIDPSYLQRKVKEYRKQLNINIPFSCHSIRHAFATFLAEEGASPVAIQTLLGHESLATTTRYVQGSDRFARKIHKKYHPLKE